MADSTTAQFPRETSVTGSWERQVSTFRQWVRADGSSAFPAAAGRYHLYVSYACPWSHRTLIFRKLKRLENVISLSVVDPLRDERGWRFREGSRHSADPINGFAFLAQAYTATDLSFQGRVTVPVLWDRQTRMIVNNESSEIIRMLNAEFDAFGGAAKTLDYYPADLRDKIDAINSQVYATINDGVYKCGFATSQAAYSRAFARLFSMLDDLDTRLEGQRYLLGDRITEADWRLFVTLVRFDAVYYVHFKCNLKRIVDYPNLWPYLRDLYQHPGVAETVDMDHIKRHYYLTHDKINPSGLVPDGPELDFDAPHARETLG